MRGICEADIPPPGEVSIKQPYKRRTPGSLKEAQSELVNLCGGHGIAAANSRVSATTIFSYTDESDDNINRHMPVDVVLQLERLAKYPVVTEHLANSMGYVMYRIEFDGTATDLHVGIIETGEEVSVLFRDWAAFISDDGIIDKNEAEKLLKDNARLVRILMKMRADLIEHIRVASAEPVGVKAPPQIAS